MSANPSKKTVSHIPNGFTSITPYFIVSDAILFSNFLHNAFDAEVIDEHFENDVLRHGAYQVFGSIIEASQSGGDFFCRWVFDDGAGEEDSAAGRLRLLFNS